MFCTKSPARQSARHKLQISSGSSHEPATWLIYRAHDASQAGRWSLSRRPTGARLAVRPSRHNKLQNCTLVCSLRRCRMWNADEITKSATSKNSIKRSMRHYFTAIFGKEHTVLRIGMVLSWRWVRSALRILLTQESQNIWKENCSGDNLSTTHHTRTARDFFSLFIALYFVRTSLS